MTDMTCTYTGNRDEMLVSYLYDDYSDSGAAERMAFDAHLRTCARCRTELAALGGVRQQLARWNPPEPNLQSAISQQPSAVGNDIRWWKQIPAWAQVAAALLFLGVSAGIANLDVHYDSTGLSVRTGWTTPKASVAPPSVGPASETWRTELASLEQRLRAEMRDRQPAAAAQARTISDTDVKRMVRPLIDESEKREQREIALRMAEVLRDVSAQRQADLVNIDRNLGLIRSNTFTVDQQQRDLRNYVLRASQRVPQ